MHADEPTTIPKRDVLGQVTITKARRKALLDQFERSGLMAKPFAKLVGLNYQTSASWIQKRRPARLQFRIYFGWRSIRDGPFNRLLVRSFAGGGGSDDFKYWKWCAAGRCPASISEAQSHSPPVPSARMGTNDRSNSLPSSGYPHTQYSGARWRIPSRTAISRFAALVQGSGPTQKAETTSAG
jgi:hypothetical protein